MSCFAVILAGGKGERFWPLSTPERPKPFLKLFQGKSLLQATGERLLRLFPEERVYVVVPPHLVPLVRSELPWLPAGNLLVEAEPKDTAFAVAFALRVLPEGTVAFFPADHYVGDEEAFVEDLRLLLGEAERREGLFLLGVSPDRPATGYGYLEMGERVGERVYRVARFLEKPDSKTAESLYRSGRHFWNAGIFVGRKEVWRGEFLRHAPLVLKGEGERISLDYALLEKSERIYMVPASFPWDDLGDWLALERRLKGEGEENLALARHVGVDTRGAILYAQGDELIVTIGLQDVVIVREGKVTLVARKDRVGELKAVLARLRAEGVKG
ncbi:mannose-1-phosphate guanylyltransferase [Thermus oshimai JL-2]|uniref:Mannose-1-phosphate guanylyltransferase n=1 Tax=Thermus oshimai JL-2 TaxID=751945 RepID=K7QTZ3_THEOS|nr:sugar phosphate nucleotidyltransferase [Thermus oshimai]AFV75536.1 mannose-1-phosphate guanylyltransferase [Thermus oshimai JL-2]